MNTYKLQTKNRLASIGIGSLSTPASKSPLNPENTKMRISIKYLLFALHLSAYLLDRIILAVQLGVISIAKFVALKVFN